MKNRKLFLSIVCITFFLFGAIGFFVYPTSVKMSLNQYTITEDGVKICYDVFEPSNNDSANKKAIIMGHGFTVSKEYLRVIAMDLAANDFVVVTFDFRGHGKSGGDLNFQSENMDFTQNSPQSFEKMLFEVQAMKDYLEARNDIDMENLGYLGYSMGGGVGFEICFNDNDFKAMVGLSPIPDFEHTNRTNPQNLLLILGKYDELISFDQLLLVMENKTELAGEEIELNQLYGSFEDGTATKFYLDETSDHVVSPYDIDNIREIRYWFLKALQYKDNGPSDVNMYLIQIILILFALIGGSCFIIMIMNYVLVKRRIKQYKNNDLKLEENTNSEIERSNKNLRSNIVESKYYKKLNLIQILVPLILGILLITFTSLVLSYIMVSMLLCSSCVIFFLNQRIRKRSGKDFNQIYLNYFKDTSKMDISYSVIFGIMFFLITNFSIGNIFSINPGLMRLIWYPLFFISVLFTFININAAYLPFSSKYLVPRIRKTILKNKKTIGIFLGLLILIIILLPILIFIYNLSVIVFIIIIIPFLLIILDIPVYMYEKSGNIIIPSIISAITLSFLIMTVSPRLSIFLFIF